MITKVTKKLLPHCHYLWWCIEKSAFVSFTLRTSCHWIIFYLKFLRKFCVYISVSTASVAGLGKLLMCHIVWLRSILWLEFTSKMLYVITRFNDLTCDMWVALPKRVDGMSVVYEKSYHTRRAIKDWYFPFLTCRIKAFYFTILPMSVTRMWLNVCGISGEHSHSTCLLLYSKW